jgi:hypothetical protein
MLSQGYGLERIRINKRNKADINQSRLGKKVLHEFKQEVKTQSNKG